MLSACALQSITKHLGVLRPSHSCPVLGSSEQSLLGDSSLTRLRFLRTAMNQKCFFSNSLFLPFSFHKYQTFIVLKCRSCPLLLPTHSTFTDLFQLVIQCFLKDLKWHRWHWKLVSRTGSLPTQREMKKSSLGRIRSMVSPCHKVTSTFFNANFFIQNLFVCLFSCCPTQGFLFGCWAIPTCCGPGTTEATAVRYSEVLAATLSHSAYFFHIHFSSKNRRNQAFSQPHPTVV